MNKAEERLNKALILDKHFNPEKIRNVIKSDIFAVLKNYGEIEAKDLFFDITILDDASYCIKFNAKLSSIKTFKSI